jgi:hypothetical protein
MMLKLGVFQDEDTATDSDFKEKLGIFRHPIPEAGPAARPKFVRAHSREIKVSHLNSKAKEVGREP